MAWNTQTVMSERAKMIVDFESGGYSKAALARRYGVSRKSVYKWIERYEQESFEGLKDRARAPLHQPHALSPEMEGEVLALKARWPLWGAPKLHYKLLQHWGAQGCPSESTVSNVLRRNGLSQPMKRRRKLCHHSAPDRSYGTAPNEVWCADFKGWFKLRNGQRCDPLTITDAASRYLIRCQALGGAGNTEMLIPIFLAAFREHGLPGAIRTDNGPPFATSGLGGLSRLSVWWLKLGIELQRIQPGHPEQNGRHERMHRTLQETLNATGPAASLRAQQKAFLEFCQHYNQERPHEALGFAVPAACYEPSVRQWSERHLADPQYPEQWTTRAVRGCGQMGWKGRDVRIHSALVGERIGLKPVDEGLWDIYFAKHLLGRFEERQGRVLPVVAGDAPGTTRRASGQERSPASLRWPENTPARTRACPTPFNPEH